MGHDRRGSREHLHAVGIIIGIGGKEYGLVSETCRVCRFCDCESKRIVRTRIKHQGFGCSFILFFY